MKITLKTRKTNKYDEVNNGKLAGHGNAHWQLQQFWCCSRQMGDWAYSKDCLVSLQLPCISQWKWYNDKSRTNANVILW